MRFKRTTPSVASQEYETSYSDLMSLSPHDSLIKFYARHDQRNEQVTARTSQLKACSKGCSYCCHFKIIADAVEIFALLEYVKTRLDQQQFQEIIQSARQNIEQAKALSHQQQATINQKCPTRFDR